MKIVVKKHVKIGVSFACSHGVCVIITVHYSFSLQKLLPADKPRVLHGGWRPDVVLHLISAGVDIFDSSIVYVTTEKGCAFTFGLSLIHI